jgi:ABC-type arginine transport system permease subunit
MNTIQTIFFWAGIVETIFLVILAITAVIMDRREKKWQERENKMRNRYNRPR